LGDQLERAELVDRVFGGEFTADDDLFELLTATEPGSCRRSTSPAAPRRTG
jgi:hypothetical protein